MASTNVVGVQSTSLSRHAADVPFAHHLSRGFCLMLHNFRR